VRRDAESTEPRSRPFWLFAAAAVISLLSSPLCPGAGLVASATSVPAAAAAPGPEPAYRCAFNVDTDAFTGADGTASAIGWLGDHNSVITCLGGTFVIQDGPGGLFQDYGFGIYAGQRMTWTDTCRHRRPCSASAGAPRSPSPSSPTASSSRVHLSSRSTAVSA